MATGAYVYLYRTLGGAVRYGGFGHEAERAMSHAQASHNKELKDWLDADQYHLSIAGSYKTAEEGEHVEAAPISA